MSLDIAPRPGITSAAATLLTKRAAPFHQEAAQRCIAISTRPSNNTDRERVEQLYQVAAPCESPNQRKCPLVRQALGNIVSTKVYMFTI